MRARNTRNLGRIVAGILIAAFPSQALFAQPRSTSGRWFCLRGAPIQRCRTFAIVEAPIGANVGSTLRTEARGFGDAYLGLELGGMVNRDDAHAVGGSVAAGIHGGESHVSITARSRKWFSGKTYRDLSAGVVAMGGGRATAYGLTARAGSGFADLIGVWAGADVGLIGGPPRASVHVGVRLGTYPAIAVTGLAVAILGAMQGGGT
jgi:hypothetical protein